jgi:hypothetical protein
LIVLDTPLSVHFWKTAWCRTCHSNATSCAVTNTRWTSSGTPGSPCTNPRRATSSMRASEWKPRSRATCSKMSLMNGSTRSPTLWVKATANAGSIPDEAPAIIEMVPVGAIVVTVELRSGRPLL